MRISNNQFIQEYSTYFTAATTTDDLPIDTGLILVFPTNDMDELTGVVGFNRPGALLSIINRHSVNSLVIKHIGTSTFGNGFYCYQQQDIIVPPLGMVQCVYVENSYVARLVDTNISNIIPYLDTQYLKLDASNSPLTGFLILNADPVNALGAATKSYVDNILTTISWKDPVRVATTANITLSGLQTIDGVSVLNGESILVKNQTTQTDNGVYLASSGSWTRRADADTGAELVGATVLVKEGTTQGNTQWTNNNPSITLGSTNITFAQIAGQGVYVNGTGLLLTGNVFSIDASYTANAARTGYLSNTDWTIFNNKVDSVTLNTGNVIYNPVVNFSVVGGLATGTMTFKTQTANTHLSGPATGAAANPTFRALVNADLPLSGVSPGTYNAVVVDNKGIVTSGNNTNVLIGTANVYHTADITASGASTPTPVLFNTNASVTGFLGHSTLSNTSRIVCNAPGRIIIHATVQGARPAGGPAANTLSIWWRKNGSDIIQTRVIQQVEANSQRVATAFLEETVALNDYIELYFSVGNTNLTLDAGAAGSGGTTSPSARLFAELYTA